MSLVRSQPVRPLVRAGLALALSLTAACMTDDETVVDDTDLLEDEPGLDVVSKDDPPPPPFECGANFDFCADMQSGAQTIPSPRRVDRVVGELRIDSGRLRMRIFSSHAGDDRLLYSVTLGPTTEPIRKGVPTAVDRHMRVVIDDVQPGTVYNLWLDFQG